MENQEPGIKSLDDRLESLLDKVDEKTPEAQMVKHEISDVGDKYKDYVDKLKERKSKLQDDISNAEEFQKAVQELESWLPVATENIASLQPISTEPDTVKKQLEDLEVR
mgnify:CR=1 FL=1